MPQEAVSNVEITVTKQKQLVKSKYSSATHILPEFSFFCCCKIESVEKIK